MSYKPNAPGIRRIACWASAALAMLLAGCASLPSLEGRGASSALTDTAETTLGRVATPAAAAHPGLTGIHPLPDPRDAFAVRVLLAAVAEKSLDAQYFIWHGDQVGHLLFEAIWQAAARGVRVRLLLDDYNTSGLDPVIAALAVHPNIEVRLYNPLVQRAPRALNYLTDFTRVNHRMHNKSFTADNQVAVVGGRNIANEYFGAGSGIGFADLDVIAVGAAVRDVSKEFDLFWNSPSAYPAAPFVGPPGPDGAARLEAAFAATHADPEALAYIAAVRAAPLVRDLLDRKLALEWTPARVVHDDPAKTLDTSGRTDVLLFPALVETMGRPMQSLDLVSPYFVPGANGTAALAALAGRGVAVRILTNSLAASDEKSVHAGYAKRRHDLLRAGVRLYEMKPTAATELRADRTRFGHSSSAGLHAKTFAVDRRRIFVGSFNFDPRSALLNTEMGLVIDSPLLAQRLGAFFDTEVPAIAYEVRLMPDGETLEWIDETPSGEVRFDVDPGTSWFLRREVDLMSVLPIEWLL